MTPGYIPSRDNLFSGLSHHLIPATFNFFLKKYFFLLIFPMMFEKGPFLHVPFLNFVYILGIFPNYDKKLQGFLYI